MLPGLPPPRHPLRALPLALALNRHHPKAARNYRSRETLLGGEGTLLDGTLLEGTLQEGTLQEGTLLEGTLKNTIGL